MCPSRVIKSPFPEGKGLAGIPGGQAPGGERQRESQAPEPSDVSTWGCDRQHAQEAFLAGGCHTP